MTDITVNQPTPPANTGDLPGQSSFRPLGGSPMPDAPGMIQGLNGIVTNMATALVETQNVSKSILADAERVARLQGIAMKAATDMMGGSQSIPVAYASSGMVDFGYLSAAHEKLTANPDLSGGPTPAHESQEAQEAAARAQGLGEGPARPAQGTYPLPAGFQLPGNWDEGKKYDLGALRQNVARGVNRQVSEWGGSSEQVLRDQRGRYAGVRPAPAGSPAEVRVRRTYDEAGRLVRDEAGNGIIEEFGPGGWRYEALAMARNVAGSMAEGEGIGASISSAAPAVGKALGVAGAVYMGANTALNFAESQRSQNMAFQSVLGGSNAEGFQERMKQNVFRLGMRGTMGGGDAEAIYKAGMEAYGTRGGMRAGYQDAAVSMYGAGIGSDESIQLLDLAAKNGNDSIRELASSVVELSHTAREAGTSAKEARDKFAESMQGLAGTASGTNQIQSAAIDATVRTNLGSRFNDVTFGGQNSELGQRRIAQMLGVSYSSLNASLNAGSVQVQVPGRADPMSGTQALAIGKDRMMNRAVQMADPSGKLRSAIMKERNRIKAETGEEPTSAQLEEIAAQVQQDNPQLADPMRISGILSSVGGAENVTDSNAMAFFARQSTNQRQNEAAYDDSTKGVKFNVKPGSEGGFKGIEDPSKLKDDYRKAYNFVEEELGYKLGQRSTQRKWAKGELDEGKGRMGNRRSTSDQVRNILANKAAEGEEITSGMMQLYDARDDLSDARFVVQTKGGKERSVEYGELVRYYSDQIKANPETIQIQGGRYEGMDLYEAFGIEGSGGKAKSAGQKAKAGVSVDDGKKKVKGKGKGDGKVEIYLTDEARKLIGVKAWGSAEEARANGVQPPSSASTPPGD